MTKVLKTISWTDETKVDTAYYHKHLITTGNHGDGRSIIWACFAGTGPEKLAVNDKLYFIPKHF